jgi:hypothetical protein
MNDIQTIRRAFRSHIDENKAIEQALEVFDFPKAAALMRESAGRKELLAAVEACCELDPHMIHG